MASDHVADLHLLENSGGQGREMVRLEQDIQAFRDMEDTEIINLLGQILGGLGDILGQLREQDHPPMARPRRGCTRFREMTHQLPHGTFVRHRTTNGQEAIGTYNEQRGVLEWQGQTFEYPSGFAKAHRGRPTNGWGMNVCHALLDGHWVSLHSLR